jgi:hypothetical protein
MGILNPWSKGIYPIECDNSPTQISRLTVLETVSMQKAEMIKRLQQLEKLENILKSNTEFTEALNLMRSLSL